MNHIRPDPTHRPTHAFFISELYTPNQICCKTQCVDLPNVHCPPYLENHSELPVISEWFPLMNVFMMFNICTCEMFCHLHYHVYRPHQTVTYTSYLHMLYICSEFFVTQI